MSGESVPPPVLSVRGGRGGTVAWTDDLDHLAERLRSTAEGLGETAAATAAVARDGALLLSALSSPVTAARAELALTGALLGPHGLAGCALRLETLGVAVGSATAVYRAGEESVRRLFRELDLTAGRLVGVVVLASAPQLCLIGVDVAVASRIPFVRNRIDPQATGGRMVEFLARHPTLSEHVMDAVPGAVQVLAVPVVGPRWGTGLDDGFPPRDVREASALVGELGAVSPLLREPATVRISATAPIGAAAPAGLGDVLGRVSRMSPGEPGPGGAPIPPGTVRVERITGSDGRRAWIVEIPGTHSWQPVTGTDPFDVTSCVHALAGQSSAAGATVVAALRHAGARPDEPVLLAGHSLGGMVAAQLAADPSLHDTFHITHVVTAGAPIALSRVPDQVHVLSIEHADDLVPRLDGTENPDRPGWVTVSRPATDTPLGPVPGSEQTGDDAHPRLEVTHDAAGYARTATRIDVSPDPSLAAWRSELTPFLNRPGAIAVAWDVTGERMIVPEGPGR